MRLTRVLMVSLILIVSFVPSVYGLTAFTDGFESPGAAWDDLWDGNGATLWTQGQAGEGEAGHSPYGGSNDAWCDLNGVLLTSDNINLLGATTASLTFWYYLDDTEAGDLVLLLFDGSVYDTIASIGGGTESTWLQYTIPSLDSQYFISNFRIQFNGGTMGSGENGFVDDVLVSYTTSSEYSRAASQSITWASSVSKSLTAVRGASQSLSLSATTSRAIIVGRAASQALVWSSVTSRILEFGRSASQSLNWGSSINQILDYGRAATQALTWTSTVAQELDYGRIAAQTLNWTSSTLREMDITRLAAQTLTISSLTEKLIEVTRDATQSVTTSWGAWGDMAGLYNAVADLILYVKTWGGPMGGGSSGDPDYVFILPIVTAIIIGAILVNGKKT